MMGLSLLGACVLLVVCIVIDARLTEACGPCELLSATEVEALDGADAGLDDMLATLMYLPLLLAVDVVLVAIGTLGSVIVRRPGPSRAVPTSPWVGLGLVVALVAAQWLWRDTITLMSMIVE